MGPQLVAALRFTCGKHTRIDERRMRRDGAAGTFIFEPCVHEWREESQREKSGCAEPGPLICAALDVERRWGRGLGRP
ncbi:hypothetical protein AMTR_s00012p00051790 [Amborella trichopoda]|uniref:Uncharacterized protein n=1 Tax=Amborella trichopoda TaxID=13333 RepID=W1PKT7_AMBTC|nr:hypothetical protein AMTR_s00012p00051790 [Amborella trichopoda]